MTKTCCSNTHDFAGLDRRYKRILWTVIIINGAMFMIEMFAGHTSSSQALKSDALDFLADSVTYGLSLAVIGYSVQTRAKAALFKAISLFVIGGYVLIGTLYRTLFQIQPEAEIMGIIGFLALIANLVSVLLLMRYKDGDSNVRSVWLCSRNDAVGNIAVMIASLAVFWLHSPWPDLIVAFLMSGLFVHSAQLILRQSLDELAQK